MDYIMRTLLAISIGCLASTGHYFKKRYWDMTTKDLFFSYFHWRDPYLRAAIGALICAEVPLAYSTVDTPMTFDLLISFAGTGYMCDSVFNKATEQQL
jgi:hypothetical protein